MADLKIKKRRLLEFIGEFGPPESLPSLDSLRRFLPDKELWPLDWKALERRCVHGDILLRWISEPQSLKQLIDDSQDYQAFLYKYHTEFYRRHKFDPCNGCLFFHFKDCWPAITASVVDYYGEKKKAYYTLKQAFRPAARTDGMARPGGRSGRRAAAQEGARGERSSPPVRVAGGAMAGHRRRRQGARRRQHRLPHRRERHRRRRRGGVWQIPEHGAAPYTIRLRLDAADQHVSSNEYLVKVRPD